MESRKVTAIGRREWAGGESRQGDLEGGNRPPIERMRKSGTGCSEGETPSEQRRESRCAKKSENGAVNIQKNVLLGGSSSATLKKNRAFRKEQKKGLLPVGKDAGRGTEES